VTILFGTMLLMKEVLFVTTNPRKVGEADQALRSFGIVTKPTKVEVDEIQSLDPAKITIAKAIAAYAVLELPVVVSDISWNIPALGGFPGGYMKHMGLWLSEQDWLNLMAPHDRTIVCQDHIAYHDGTNTEHFSTECEGVFLAQPQGPEVMIGNESFRRIVSLDGASSLAEQATEKNFADRPMYHWAKLGQWLTDSQTECSVEQL